jgi:3-hydroxy-5-methyl-1-naphthoate 3-O-methyltransferase
MAPLRQDRQPARDDRRIYDAYIAGRQSAALAAGVRSGLFDALDGVERGLDELAQALAVAPRPLAGLLRALVAMGLVVRRVARFALADDAAAYLVRGKPDWLGGLIDLEVEQPLTPALVLAALRDDRPSVYGGEDPWAAHARDASKARAFTEAMHSISAMPAQALAAALDLHGVARVLDVGGGSGAFAIALARREPGLRCSVLELPAVCPLVTEQAERAHVADRVTARAADFWTDPWPGPQNAVLFSQILHDWSPSKARDLLARARGVLPVGGRVWIHEKLVDDDGAGPLANALVDLDMLVWTEGQQWNEAELRELLRETGFGDVRRLQGHGYWSILEGRAVVL